MPVATQEVFSYGVTMRSKLYEDPIVKETRAAREQLLKRFDYDLDSLCTYLAKLEAQREKKAVTLEPRRPKSNETKSFVTALLG